MPDPAANSLPPEPSSRIRPDSSLQEIIQILVESSLNVIAMRLLCLRKNQVALYDPVVPAQQVINARGLLYLPFLRIGGRRSLDNGRRDVATAGHLFNIELCDARRMTRVRLAEIAANPGVQIQARHAALVTLNTMELKEYNRGTLASVLSR